MSGTLRIQIAGLGEWDQDIDLDALTLLNGPNGTGKTTILNAWRIIALGFVPLLGDRVNFLEPLMREDTATITAWLPAEPDTTRKMIRRIVSRARKDADSPYAYTLATECSWLDADAKPTEHHAAAMALFGQEKTDVAECLDIRELLALTGNRRAERIERMLASTATPREEKAELVAKMTVQALLGLSDEDMKRPAITEDWPGALLPLVAPEQVAILDVAGRELEQWILTLDVVGALSKANEHRRSAALEQTKKTQAKTELQTRVDKLEKVDPAEIVRLDTEHGRLERAVGAAQERHTRLTEQADALQNAQADVRGAENMVRALREQRQTVARDIADASRKQQRVAELDEQLQHMVAPEPVAFADAAALDDEAVQIESALQHLTLPEIPSATESDEQLAAVRRRLAAAAASPWAKVRQAHADLDAVAPRLAKLKARGADEIGTAFQLVRALLGEALEAAGADDVDVLKDEETRVCAARDELRARIEEATAARAQAERDRDAQQERARDLRQRAAAIRRERSEAHQAQLETFRQRQHDATTEHAAMQQALRELTERDTSSKSALERAEGALVNARKRVEDLTGAQPDAGAQFIVQAGTEATIADLEAERDKVKVRRDELIGIRGARDQLAELVADLKKAEATTKVWAAIEGALQTMRAIEITQMGGPIREQMAVFFAGAGVDADAYLRASKGVCDLGWRIIRAPGQPRRTVSIQAMGGGEWVLFVAAFTAALVILRGSACRLLLTEAAECDLTTLVGLMNGIAAVADQLTAAIVSYPNAVRVLPAHWSVRQPSGVAGYLTRGAA